MAAVSVLTPLRIAHVVEGMEEHGPQGHDIDDASASCTCAPRVECVLNDDKDTVIGFVVVHNRYGPN